MEEIEQLKARIVATNSFLMEAIEREIGHRMTIAILQQQLRDLMKPPVVEAEPSAPSPPE